MKLEEHPFFVAFPKEHSFAIQQSALLKRFEAQSVIFEEGSASEDFCLILEGAVNFLKKLPDGREQSISTSQAGEFFGEIGVLTQSPRSLKAQAQTATLLAFIPRKDFLSILQLASPISQIVRGLIQHLHLTTTHYVENVLQQEKLSLVGTMINSLLHDFKNPFSVITMSAQLLAGEHSDDLTQELCKNIEDQITYMLKMASEISEFSQGKRSLTISNCNLKNLLDRFIELNPILSKDPQIKLDIQVPDIEIEAEDIKLLRVVQNLITNAVEACKVDTKEPKKQGKVSIHAHDRGDTVQLMVSDNGRGIPPEIQAKFFKPFVTYGKAKGTGLGAAIVKSIVENHGGHISFETGPNGTTFNILLPKKQKIT